MTVGSLLASIEPLGGRPTGYQHCRVLVAGVCHTTGLRNTGLLATTGNVSHYFAFFGSPTSAKAGLFLAFFLDESKEARWRCFCAPLAGVRENDERVDGDAAHGLDLLRAVLPMLKEVPATTLGQFLLHDSVNKKSKSTPGWFGFSQLPTTRECCRGAHAMFMEWTGRRVLVPRPCVPGDAPPSAAWCTTHLTPYHDLSTGQVRLLARHVPSLFSGGSKPTRVCMQVVVVCWVFFHKVAVAFSFSRSNIQK